MHKAVRRILNFFSFLIALGLVICVAAFGGIMYFNAAPAEAPHPNEEAMHLDEKGNLVLGIKSGETAYSVGARLENAGVIRSRYFWYLLSRMENHYIKTGMYLIELPASQMKIHSLLVSGDQMLMRITIPEGVTLKKASRIFEEEGICNADEFLAAASSAEILDKYHVPGPTMEGYLYPDTYLFPLAYPAEKVVSAMADTFFRRLAEIAPGAAAPDALNQAIVIASIVEREYRVPEEAPLMAGVFYNRLKIGMPLQSCATVEYVITEIEGKPHPEILYNRDIEIRNPYNTYIRQGLPPGPISCPGETALKAAFNPASSNYLYFRLIDPHTGRHYFSRTLDDHIRAGALYTKGS